MTAAAYTLLVAEPRAATGLGGPGGVVTIGQAETTVGQATVTAGGAEE